MCTVNNNFSYLLGQEYVITNKSDVFNYFGLKIFVEENSLPEDVDKCVLHVSFDSSTHLKIPAQFKLISSIYQLECKPNIYFKKPLEMQMEHCVTVDPDCLANFVFAQQTSENKEFEILKDGSFSVGKIYGSIKLSHFCKVCALFRETRNFICHFFQTVQMYCLLLFSKSQRNQIDIKCILCWNKQKPVEVRFFLPYTHIYSLNQVYVSVEDRRKIEHIYS